MNKRIKPSPAQTVINEWVERCETEQVLRKSYANFQWNVSPGASGPYENSHMEPIFGSGKPRLENQVSYLASNHWVSNKYYHYCNNQL